MDQQDALRFTAVHGSQTFTHTSARLSALAIYSPGSPSLEKPTWLKEVIPRDPASKVVVLPASDPSKSRGDKHGSWYRCAYLGAEGDILALKSHATIDGILRYHGALIVRLRADAPVISVTATVPLAQGAFFSGEVPAFSGPADVITYDEAHTVWGVRMPAGFVRMYTDPEEVEDAFSITVLNKGTPRPSVQKVRVRGQKGSVAVTDRSGTRRIRIRKD